MKKIYDYNNTMDKGEGSGDDSGSEEDNPILQQLREASKNPSSITKKEQNSLFTLSIILRELTNYSYKCNYCGKIPKISFLTNRKKRKRENNIIINCCEKYKNETITMKEFLEKMVYKKDKIDTSMSISRSDEEDKDINRIQEKIEKIKKRVNDKLSIKISKVIEKEDGKIEKMNETINDQKAI